MLRLQHIIGIVIVLIIAVWAIHQVVTHNGGGGAASAEAASSYQQGKTAYLSGNAAQGLTLAEQAIAKDPTQADYFNLAAMCCYKRDDIQGGVQYVQKAISLNPNEAKYWENLGRGLLELQKLPEAKQAFEKALACNNDPARKAEIDQIMQTAGMAK
ncbi:MAG TPA: tetratricopeptide repeat protein [Planktothrix sp.]|jgi:tetratricopeptide (TPR) repeat protein